MKEGYPYSANLQGGQLLPDFAVENQKASTPPVMFLNGPGLITDTRMPELALPF